MFVKETQKLEDGSYNTVWNLSSEEVSYLVNYAIADLIRRGLITDGENVDLDNLPAVGGLQ